jgi:Tol biopolymer transport system component
MHSRLRLWLLILLCSSGIALSRHIAGTAAGATQIFMPLVQTTPAPVERYLGLFAIGTPDDYDLYTARADGSESSQLTDKEIPITAQWSPTSTQILFQTRQTLGDELYIINPDGSELRPIPVAPGLFSAPTWSPTGAQISYISEDSEGGGKTLVVVDAPTGEALWSVTYPDVTAQWAPDGSYLALSAVLTTTTPTISSIVVVSADGTTTVQLTDGVNDYDMMGWMQGGERLLVLRTNAQTQARNLLLLNPDGSNPTVLTAVNGIASGATVSPDGTRFAYLASTADGLFLQTYRLGATAPVRVSPTVCGALPCQVGSVTWSPNSVWLTFAAYSGACPNCSVYLTRADGSAIPRANEPLFAGGKDTIWLDSVKVTVQQDTGATESLHPFVLNAATGEVITEVLAEVEGRVFIGGWKYAPSP